MIWQDTALTVIQIIFSISLIPQIHQGFIQKVGTIRYLTAIPTCIGLYVMSGIYFSLSLIFSAAMSFIIASLWLILALQRKIYHVKK